MGNCCTQTLMRLCYRLLRDYFYTKCSTWTSRKCRERYANVYTRTSVLVGLHNYLRLGATLRTHRECNIAYTNTSRAHTGDLSRGFREPIAKFFVQRTVSWRLQLVQEDEENREEGWQTREEKRETMGERKRNGGKGVWGDGKHYYWSEYSLIKTYIEWKSQASEPGSQGGIAPPHFKKTNIEKLLHIHYNNVYRTKLHLKLLLSTHLGIAQTFIWSLLASTCNRMLKVLQTASSHTVI